MADKDEKTKDNSTQSQPPQPDPPVRDAIKTKQPSEREHLQESTRGNKTNENKDNKK